MKLSLKFLINTGFTATLAFLLIIAVISNRSINNLTQNANLTEHTQKVETSIYTLLSALTDAETGVRGYLISNNVKFLEPYNRALGTIPSDFQKLRQLTTDNSQQQQLLDSLGQRIDERFNNLKFEIELNRTKGFEYARNEVASARGKNIHDQIRGIISEMIHEESHLLQQSEQKTEASTRFTHTVIITSGILAFLVVAISFILIFRISRKHKQAEDALIENERKFRETVSNLDEGYYSVNNDGMLLDHNHAFCRILGFDETSDLKGSHLPDFWQNPEDRKIYLSELTENGKISNYQINAKTNKGEPIIVIASAHFVYERSEKPAWIEGIFLDITERARLEEAIRNNEKRFRELIESLPQLFWTCRIDGPCDYLSRQWVEYTGVPEEDQLGYRWLDQLHPDDRDRTVSEWMEKVKTGESFDINFRIRRFDGIYRWFATRAVPMKAGGHKIIRWFGSNTDVDDFIRSQESLSEANENLECKISERTDELVKSKKLLVETGRLARVGGWEIDLKANKLYWSETTREIHEVDPDFSPDVESAIDFYSPEAVPVISGCVERAINLGESFDVELVLITAKKNRIWVRALGEVYRENDEIVKIGGVFQDINIRKLAELELEKYRDHLEELVKERTNELDNAIKNLQRSNQELEQFAYIASHDLQEPLRMVSSYTQLLERRYKDQLDQDAKDFINFAVDGANRMQQLINDLLDYSRVTTKGKTFVKLDLSTLLGYAVANLRNKIQETGAMIVNDELPFAYGDETQLVRVFQNLLDNAMKFIVAETPRIQVSSQTINDEVIVSVADNGIGIEKIYSERVFAIFQRLHNKSDYPGTGIGLAICKRIIERHNGKIWFESEPGKGTTFFFSLSLKH